MPDGLVCEQVSKRFAGVKALRSVDLRLVEGEILGLIGPNGSGKTTLLNCISGAYSLNLGKVLLDGKDITGLAPPTVAKLRLSRTFQNIRLFPNLTVRENVEAGLANINPSLRQRARQVVQARELLVRFGVAEVEDRFVAALPYGLQRRVEIARALATQPRYLLLDEPAAGMNEAESDDLLTLINQIRDEEGCSILIVDHDLRLIMRLCDRVQVLDQGQTIAEGSPTDVRNDPAVRSAYLGRSSEASAS